MRATWADFVPAVPVSTAGAVCAAIGFAAGWLALTGLMRLLAWPLRRLWAPGGAGSG